MANKYQGCRSVKVTSRKPLDSDTLLLKRLAATEQLSQPFHMDLTLLSEDGELDPDDMLGKPFGLALTISEDGPPRHFHGIVTEFAQTGFEERLHEYKAVVRPWFWMLTRRADCRVFQGKTVPEIFEAVCGEAGFRDFKKRLQSTYDPWEYCVQYRETDFNFLSRLLEQEGIFYYFEHDEDHHVMVLSDDVAQCGTVAGYDEVPYHPTAMDRDHLTSWSFHKSLHPGKFATRDYNFERPAVIPEATSSISRPHNPSRFEIFDYPAEAVQTTSAGVEKVAKVRVQELQAAQMVARGEGDAAGLTAGKLFKLTEYPRSDLNMQYLVTATSIDISSDNYGTSSSTSDQFAIAIEAVDAREHYRPPRVTPKPVVHGTQTAVVVGTKGEEIHTDTHGRVRVQFHWDRHGPMSDKSSCFIRVGQVWAGAGWGGHHIPRVGQEVIVAFMEGDPDDPLIIGSVYNGTNVWPYPLPDNKTRSGIKSSTTPGSGGSNELRFEDKKGSEEVYLHAQKDHTINVENDENHSVGHDESHSVANNRGKVVKADETTSIGKDRTETVGGNESINIEKDRTKIIKQSEIVTISKDYSQTVNGKVTRAVDLDESVNISGKRTESVDKDEEISVGKNRKHTIGEKDTLSVGKQLLIDAGEEVVLKAGSASLTLKKDGTIELEGADVTIKGSGKINVNASADVVVKGSKVSMN